MAPFGHRWGALRATSGWSVLQHQIFYRRTFSVPSPSLYSFDLTAAAEFSLWRCDLPSSTRRWFNGNVYAYGHASPHFVDLEKGEYEVTVTYAHDIRIAGDPAGDGGAKG